MGRKVTLAIGLILAATILLLALTAPIVAPNDPYAISLHNAFASPCGEFPLGADQLGRCLLSRALYGARISLGVMFLALGLTALIGTVVGTISGLFAGRWPDKALSALCEVVLAFPGIILALVLLGLFGPGVRNLTLAIALGGWAGYARLVRSLVIRVKNADYIKAAIVSGTRPRSMIWRHVLPNIAGGASTILVTSMGAIILQIAGLSFLGLGAPPPAAEWGMMINEARLYLSGAPRLMLVPLVAVSLSVLSFQLIGDALRDKNDAQRM